MADFTASHLSEFLDNDEVAYSKEWGELGKSGLGGLATRLTRRASAEKCQLGAYRAWELLTIERAW